MKKIDKIAKEYIESLPCYSIEDEKHFIAGFKAARNMASGLSYKFPDDYLGKDGRMIQSSKFDIGKTIEIMGEEEA